jgi:hypothetical protein
MGRNANGLIEWKFKDGRTLKDLESADSDQVNVSQPEAQEIDEIASIHQKGLA